MMSVYRSLVIFWVCFAFIACAKRDVDYDVAQNVIGFAKGNVAPGELIFEHEALISEAGLYAETIAGHLGLPEDFDLNLLMGKLLYQWGRFPEASMYLNAARNSRDKDISVVAADFLLFSLALSGRNDVIFNLKGENVNSMLSKNVWVGLSKGECQSLDQAIIDISVASRDNIITRSMQYLEFLSRWTAAFCDASYSSYYETQILNPAFVAVTAGEDWETFIEASQTGNLRPVQQVLVGDLFSIIESAVRFGLKTENAEMVHKWATRRDDLQRAAIGDKGLYSRVSLREM